MANKIKLTYIFVHYWLCAYTQQCSKWRAMLPPKDLDNLIQQAVVSQIRLDEWLKTTDFSYVTH